MRVGGWRQSGLLSRTAALRPGHCRSIFHISRSRSCTASAATLKSVVPPVQGHEDDDDDDFSLLDDLFSGKVDAPTSTPADANPEEDPTHMQDRLGQDAEASAPPQPAQQLVSSSTRPWEKSRQLHSSQPQGVAPTHGSAAQSPPARPARKLMLARRSELPAPRLRPLQRPKDTTQATPAGPSTSQTQPASSRTPFPLPRSQPPTSVSGQATLQPKPQLPKPIDYQQQQTEDLLPLQSAAASAASELFAQDPIMRAAHSVAARSSTPSPEDPDSPSPSTPRPLRSSRVFSLLEPNPLLQQHPPPSRPSTLWPSPMEPSSTASPSPVAEPVPPAGGSFTPSTRTRRRQTADPAAALLFKQTMAQEIAAAKKRQLAGDTLLTGGSQGTEGSQQQREEQQQRWQRQRSGDAELAQMMRQVASDTPSVRGGDLSAEQLPEEVTPSNWHLHARVRFPKVYDPSWHHSLYEFLFDLWAAVGKGHEAQGSNGRPGAQAPSPKSQAAQQELLEQAYSFAALCWKAADPRFKSSVAVSSVSSVCDFEAMFEESVRHLPQDMLAKGVLPILKSFDPELYLPYLTLARNHLGARWPPSLATPKSVARLLGRLKLLQRCHPEVDLAVLAYLDDDCNIKLTTD